MTHSTRNRLAGVFSLTAALIGALTMAAPLSAQTTYTAIDLTPDASGAAGAAANGQFGGYTGATFNAFSGGPRRIPCSTPKTP